MSAEPRCFRLGLIYADRLVDVPMALKAFQRALTYQPDDENTLIRLADLASQVGEWKLAPSNYPVGAPLALTNINGYALAWNNGFGGVAPAEIVWAE